MAKRLAVSGLFSLLVVQIVTALKVITPSSQEVVVAERTYTVEWTGTGKNNRVEIDLFYCGSYCAEDDCGEWVTALCPYGVGGCPDSDGDYDIVLPQPIMGTSGTGYKVRVVNAADEEDADCSEDFYLMMSEEAPMTGEKPGPHLYVTSPRRGDFAEAGETYTVEFDYDNGVGSRVDRFKIDLYAVGGTGDCGTWITTVCDKPTIGCKDSMGDYDIKIPDAVKSGDYSIRVGRFEDDTLYGCSATFSIDSAYGGDSSSESGTGSADGSSSSGTDSGTGSAGGGGSSGTDSGTGSAGGSGSSGTDSGTGSAGGSGSSGTDSGTGSAGGSGSSGTDSGTGSAGGSTSRDGWGSEGSGSSSSTMGSGGGGGGDDDEGYWIDDDWDLVSSSYSYVYDWVF